MQDWQGKRYWVVGSTGPLGREVALALSRLGCALVLSDGGGAGQSDPDALDALVATLPGRATTLPLGPGAMTADPGEVDGLVHLVALHWPMRAQEWDTGRAIAMADADFMGPLRCLGVVLPRMVSRDAGHIVLSGSSAGLRGAQGYGAAKAGVAALARGLRADLRGTGVLVQRIDLGLPTAAPGLEAAPPAPGGTANDTRTAQEIVEHMGTHDFARRVPGLTGRASLGARLSPLRGWLGRLGR